MEKFQKNDFQDVTLNNTNVRAGFYHGNFIRIFPEELVSDCKNAIKFSNKIDHLVRAEIFLEEENRFIIKHPIVKNVTFPPEWTLLQRVEAALAILSIQKELIKHGYYLSDPHGYNITFDRDKPIYIDYGSIVKGKIWPAYWFLRLFLNYGVEDYWAAILKVSKIRTFIILIRMLINEKKAYSAVEGSFQKIRSRKISERDTNEFNLFERLLQVQKIKNILKKVRKVFVKNNLYLSLESLLLKRIQHGDTDWSYYGQENLSDSSIEESAKIKSFTELMKRDIPAKMIDIAANKGVFSQLAIQYGVKEVIATDIDERSLDILRNKAKNKNLPIWVAKLDLMNHPEKLGGLKDMSSAEERLNADYSICFALVHHLCYFGNYSFEDFAKAIEKFVNKILIVEFVPYNDICLAGPVYRGKDKSWYNENNFVQAMKKYFKGDIEIFESHPSSRKLIRFQRI